ncbi:hypothetical protein TSUD_406610 [Trifolium subterraneum]|uniref:Retrotransposon gag domain-containing protein n=1 Tax=Trifolium subterraneum TaxID=3900 RepID=A0A2Z6PG29_TRISU|nr:hypothetical protein TSUD_406610 [Trifolium subterraneum]
MSTMVVPIFDGREDGYWWLIQLDRYFLANSWILEKMKVDWVTLFALRGDAYMWWSSWKQGNQNVTWKTFERAFIKKFIPDLWEMMEAAEDAHREEIQKVNTEISDDSMTEKQQVKYAEKAIDSGSLKNSSEQPDLKFPAPITTAPSIMKNHTVVVEGVEEINDESKDDEVEAVIEASIDDGEEKARFKQIDSGSETSVTAMSEVLEAVNSDVKIGEVHRGREKVTLEPPAKPPDTELKVVVSEIQITQAVVVEIQPPLKLPDAGRSGTALLRRVPPSKPPDWNKYVDREREGKFRVEKRRNMLMTVGGPLSKSSEPPYSGDNSIQLRGSIAESEKTSKKIRAKRTFVENTNLKEQDKGSNWSCCKLGPTEKLMGQAQHSEDSSVNFEWDILSKTNFLKEEFVLANSFFDVQFSLMFELNPYWLANERGMNIISQNKEKIVDILGYWGIYSIVVGVHEGNHLAFRNQSYVFRSGRIIPLIKRVVLESVGMAKPLDQGRLVEIFKYLRSSMLLMWICSRTLMSLFIVCVNPPFSNEKGMKRYEMRFPVNTNDVLPTTLLEILMPMWKEVMGSLEGVKIGFAFAMSPLHAVIQWDQGETNIIMFMLISTHESCWKCFVYVRGKLWKILYTIEVYWRMIFIYCGLHNFVFDRGRFFMDANSNLEDKVVFKEVGIDRNMDQEMGLNHEYGGCGGRPPELRHRPPRRSSAVDHREVAGKSGPAAPVPEVRR